jgi:hypothetical protein
LNIFPKRQEREGLLVKEFCKGLVETVEDLGSAFRISYADAKGGHGQLQIPKNETAMGDVIADAVDEVIRVETDTMGMVINVKIGKQQQVVLARAPTPSPAG